MRYRIVECFSKDNVVEDRLKWIYAWKQWVGVPIKFDIGVCKHRVPFFLSLHAHVKIEETLRALGNVVFPQFTCKILRFPYDFIYGFICGYSMKEILDFWNKH
jgi:hypothetical protein